MGDVIADVPGGANNHSYANVTLIVELARLHAVHENKYDTALNSRLTF